ncbi:MAG: hypothetical protein KDD68_20340 [Bdellovibrionales bacterium]|nr:hypothetical protein [Bdellovibrionales bacterium]
MILSNRYIGWSRTLPGRLLMLGLGITAVFGCQKSSNSRPRFVDPIFMGGDLDPESPVDTVDAVRKFIELANLPNRKCQSEEELDCERIKLTYKTVLDPQEPAPGEVRILFLEDQAVPRMALTASRHRTLGFYRWDKEARHFVPRDIDFTMEARSYRLFYESRGSEESHIPGKAFRTMKGLFPTPISIAKLQDKDMGLGHADFGYSLLNHLNPKARFLFAPMSSFPNGIELEDPDYLNAVREHLEGLKLAYNLLIRMYHLNRVSVAFGPFPWLQFQRRNLINRGVKPTESLHRKYLKSVQMWKMFWEELAADNPNLLIFVGLQNDLRDPDFTDGQLVRDFNCFSHPRVFRVGYVHDSTNAIPIDGNYLTGQNSSDLLRPGLACTDLAVNSGFDEDIRTRMELDPFSDAYPSRRGKRGSYLVVSGQLRVSFHMMATSWATPMALSFANRLVENYRRQNGRELDLDSLKGLVKGKAFDPYYHGQFLSNPYWDGETEEKGNCETQRTRDLYTGCITSNDYVRLRSEGRTPLCANAGPNQPVLMGDMLCKSL